MIRIHIQFYAQLREQAQTHQLDLDTTASDTAALYRELRERFHFSIEPASLRVAINHQFSDWTQSIADGDIVTFVPPVAGG